MYDKRNSAVVRLRFALLLILIIGIGASALQAQVLFSFNVNDLEAYDRSGNWIYDADGPTGPPYPLQDQDWFSLNPVPAYPFHYYAERYIHEGVPTTLTCLAENVAQADNPGQLTMSFTQFNLVSFKRINTVNPLAPWNIPGQSGDERVYANAGGTISYNGTPVLTMTDATFVITTPYPNQAQIQALNPIFATWTGDIGTGAPQTGFGYGDLDLAHSDPAWIPLFAASNYKIELQMGGLHRWSHRAHPNFTIHPRASLLPATHCQSLCDRSTGRVIKLRTASHPWHGCHPGSQCWHPGRPKWRSAHPIPG